MISDSKLYLSSTTVNSCSDRFQCLGQDVAGNEDVSRSEQPDDMRVLVLGKSEGLLAGCKWHVYYDYMHTHSSTSTSVNDNVYRYGTTFYKYGVAYNSGSVVFYVMTR